MKLRKIPQDAIDAMDNLPQETLDEIQMKLVLFSGLDAIKMGPREPSKNELTRMLNRTADEQIRLLRKAAKELT